MAFQTKTPAVRSHVPGFGKTLTRQQACRSVPRLCLKTMLSFLSKLFPNKNERLVKKLTTRLGEINRLEEELQSASPDVLRQKTQQWKEQLTPEQ